MPIPYMREVPQISQEELLLKKLQAKALRKTGQGPAPVPMTESEKEVRSWTPEKSAEHRASLNANGPDIEFMADIAERMGPLAHTLRMNPQDTKFISHPDAKIYHKGSVNNPVFGEAMPKNADFGDAEPGDPGTKGMSVFYTTDGANPEGYEGNYNAINFTLDPGQLAVYGPQGANRRTWGHEGLHAEQNWPEYKVRLQEAYSARTKHEWDKQVARWAEYNDLSLERSEEIMRDRLNGYGSSFFKERVPRREYAKGARLAPIPEDKVFRNFLGFEIDENDRHRRDNYVEQRNKQSYWARELRDKE